MGKYWKNVKYSYIYIYIVAKCPDFRKKDAYLPEIRVDNYRRKMEKIEEIKENNCCIMRDFAKSVLDFRDNLVYSVKG